MTSEEAYEAHRRRARDRYRKPPTCLLMLPQEYRGDVNAVYAFARSTDGLANGDFGMIEARDRLGLIDWHEKEFEHAIEGESAEPDLSALKRTIGSRQLSTGPFKDLILAARQDITQLRYNNFEEVKEYCRRSANPLGRMVMNIFGCRDEEKLRLADRIAMGLRLAFMWQRVGADLQMDRIYLPQDEMANFGVSDETLKGSRFDEGVLRLLQFQVRRTREILDSGRRLSDSVDRQLRGGIRLARLTAEEMLNKIENQGLDVLHRPVRLSNLNFMVLLARAFLGRG